MCVYVCACAQLCPALCDPMDCSPPGSSVHGIFLAGILQQVVIFPPEDLLNPWTETMSLVSPALVGGFFYHCATWEAQYFSIVNTTGLTANT